MKRLLIPLFFIVLAALACDAPVYDVPRILGVRADVETAGRVYAEVGNTEAKSTYVSEDYGRTWQRTAEAVETSYNEAYSMQGDTLYYQGNAIWWFPRPTFRFFFLDDEYRQHFALPTWSQVSISEAYGVLYVGMGTEGVLTFTMPGEWHLSAAGIAQLDPIPLTITHPPTLAGIIALALLIPPLGLMHSFLLTRVWLYALPGRKAWRAALMMTGMIMLLAALAIVVWLTDARTDYYGIVAVMSVVTLILSVGAALIAVPEEQAWLVGRRTALVSLIVPLGVATIWWGWLLIIPLMVCYAIYGWMYRRLLKRENSVSIPLLDRLTLRSVLNISVTFTLFIVGSVVISSIVDRIGFVLIAMLPFVLWWTIHRTTRDVERQLAQAEMKIIAVQKWVTITTISCYVLAPILAGAAFYGQGFAHQWFTMLLVP